MSSIRFSLVLALFAAGVSSLGCSAPPTAESQGTSALGERLERRPRSIVLVTVDTTRADHLEPYGAENVRTPRLQRLAREGILVETAWAVAPLTLPAHTSILTGLAPPRTGVRNNGTHFASEELTTLAELLTAAGYRSGAFVSASVLERRYGLDQGFEVYDDDLSKSRLRLPRIVPDRPAEFTVAAAREWLDGLEEDRRFFLWVHLYDPHAAYNPPPPWRDEYRTHLYAGEIAYMDHQIGVLLDHPRISRRPDVAVAVIGDHGESLGEHGENTHGILPYRATLQVPWILWTGDGPGGLRVTRPASQIDLAPTLLDLVALPVLDGMSGRSLLRTDPPERSLYSESYLPFYTYGWAKLRVLRRGRWELVDGPDPELYDLVRDPRELSNQVLRRPEIVSDLRGFLADVLDEAAPEGEKEAQLQIDQESLAALRALGYVAMSDAPGPADGPRPDPKAMIGLHVAQERARGFLNDGLHREAAELLEGLLRKDPTNLAALADLAIARRALGETEAAVLVVERALELDPDHQQLLLMLAGIEEERGEGDRALALAERVLTLNPTHMGAWSFEARLQAALGRPKEAEATLERALEIEPLHPRLNAIYAQTVEIPAGRVEEAERRLRQAAARDPFVAFSWRVLGRLLEHLGRPDEAETAYRSGLEHTPDDGSLHAHLAVLLARRGDPDAEAHLREAIRFESEVRSELYVSLGALLAEKGRLEEARELYDRVLAADPEQPAARNNRAVAAASSGRIDEALAELRALTREVPAYADAHNNLAVLLLERGDAAGAEAHARRTIELAPATAESWDVLGASLVGQGRTPEALEALDRAVELSPDAWSPRLNRGLARKELGRADGAREDLEAALVARPDLPEAVHALARLWETELGDPERARQYDRLLLERFPDDPRAAAVRERLGSPER